MDEQKETQEKPEIADENSSDGSKYETTPIIERARVERERLEQANQKHEELLNRQEAINARAELGGTADAGLGNFKKEKLTDEQYANSLADSDENLLFPDIE